MDFLQKTLDAWIYIAVFAGIWFIQLSYYLVVFGRVAFGGKKNISKTIDIPFSVSIVLTAHNAEDLLANNLPHFLEQDFPSEYEVVVVNDRSTDASEEILAAMSVQYPNLHVTYIREDEKFKTTKKLALTVGIKATKHDWILFSELDTVPSGPGWLASMQRYFTPRNEIVLGYNTIAPSKNWGNIVFRYNRLVKALHFLGMAMINMPYMAMSRNFAYRKSLFFENKGFAGHVLLPYGEDDLFVQNTGSRDNTYVNIEADAITISRMPEKPEDKKDYCDKYLLSARNYRFIHKVRIVLEPLSRILFFAGLIVLLLLFPDLWPVMIGAFIIRTIIQTTVIYKAGKQLNEPWLAPFGWILDIFYSPRDIYNALSIFLPAKK